MNQNQPSQLVKTLLGAFLLLVLSVPAWASGGNGMTWGKGAHNSADGTELVGCGTCNPYVGDTACTASLPLLCFKSDGLADSRRPHPGFLPWLEGAGTSRRRPRSRARC